jgi:PAS domain S-box-containing protein
VKLESPNRKAQAIEARARYEDLRARSGEETDGEVLASTVQELSVTIEELRVANEASKEYSTALATAREALASERVSYQTLYEYAPDGYLVTDSVGLVLRANRMAAELFGVPRGHLISKPITVFVKLDERRDFRALLCRIGNGNSSMFTFESTLEARGGRTFTASIRVAGGGNELRWTIRDVTEQRRAERSLSEAHAKLGQRTRELEGEIDERRHADENLRRSEERYRMLSAHLHEGIEEERTRIAREVHDELGSALTAIRFELSDLRSVPQADEAVRRAIGRVDAAIRATRRICSDLRPSLLDHMGLWAAIEWFVEDMAGRSGIQCQVELEPGSDLAEPVRTSVFRIVQEAVTNTVRHANASSLRVSARGKAGELEILVADNGRGIGSSELARPDAFGIAGMQERARACGGRIVIGSAEQGTRVLLRVPLASGGTPCAS